jgi:hypothetical protein
MITMDAAAKNRSDVNGGSGLIFASGPMDRSALVSDPKSSGRAANGVFLRSDALVRHVRSAPVLENHHFRLGLPIFDSDT